VPSLEKLAASNYYYEHMMKGMKDRERLKKSQADI